VGIALEIGKFSYVDIPPTLLYIYIVKSTVHHPQFSLLAVPVSAVFSWCSEGDYP
jgi:hypothetical protein